MYHDIKLCLFAPIKYFHLLRKLWKKTHYFSFRRTSDYHSDFLLYYSNNFARTRQNSLVRTSKQWKKTPFIKISLCLMLSFYFLILPLTIVANLLPDPKVFKSSSVLQNIWLLVQLVLYTSSIVNPIICIAFVQSFRRA